MRNLFKKRFRLGGFLIILIIFVFLQLRLFDLKIDSHRIFIHQPIMNYSQINGLEISATYEVSGTPIYINDLNSNYSWSKTAADYEWCTGSGTEFDPYIIQDVLFDAQNTSINCLEIRQSRVFFIIQNCTFYNTLQDGGIYFSNGIRIYNSSNGIITRNEFTDCGGGLELDRCDYISMSENVLSNIFRTSFMLSSGSNNTIRDNFATFSGGIYLAGCQDSKVVGNEFGTIRSIGINLGGSSYNNISKNIVRHPGRDWSGIHLSHSHSNAISENEVYDCKGGIDLLNSNLNYFLKNKMSGNRYGSYYLRYSNNNSFYLNEIDNWNDNGFRLVSSHNNDFISNNIKECMYGFKIEGSSYNKISANRIKFLIECFSETGVSLSNAFEENICEFAGEPNYAPPIIFFSIAGSCFIGGIIFLTIRHRRRTKIKE